MILTSWANEAGVVVEGAEVDVGEAEAVQGDLPLGGVVEAHHHCPGRKPAFLVFKRPARPYKSPIQNRFT